MQAASELCGVTLAIGTRLEVRWTVSEESDDEEDVDAAAEDPAGSQPAASEASAR